MDRKHVFVSHAWGPNKEGHHWARHLADRLEKEHGIRCWVDDQEQNLVAGVGLNRQLQLAIQDCPAFVAVLCNSYKASANCMAELSHAFTHDKGPIPILREGVTKIKHPEAFYQRDDTVYLPMVSIEDYDKNLPKLAEAIRRKGRIKIWLLLRRLLGMSLILLALIGLINWKPWAHGPADPSELPDVVPPTTQRDDRITVPEDGKTALFYSRGSQGGLVLVDGESKELKRNEVILLVVNADNGIAYPQTNVARGIIPDRNGKWTAEVQVGNGDFEPSKGLKFTVGMYVLKVEDYLLLKRDNQATGGHAVWPPASWSEPPTEHASTTFTLE